MELAHTQEEHHDRHPGPRQYVIIGAILAVLTAAEVGAFLSDMTPWAATGILIVLSLTKFALVVGWFMHLRFDDKRFLGLFVFPFIVIISIVLVLLASFDNLTR